MCQASVHVEHRMANESERLVMHPVPGHSGMKGFYPVGGRDERMVCLRGKKTVVIKQVQFEPGISPKLENAWQGKKNVTATFSHQGYYDYIIFPDGLSCLTSHFVKGVRIDYNVPVRVRKPKGMTVVEKAVKEAMALPPEPKPEDEEGRAPTDPTPEREPEPANDRPAAPAARR